MAGHVEMLGFAPRDDIYRRLARASVVVGPTIGPEGFGRLPLEAAIARRPIVASAQGGHLETIIDGTTGRLVAPGDRTALAQAIVDLVTHPDAAAAMGEAAHAHVLDRFSAQAVADRLAGAWRTLLGQA